MKVLVTGGRYYEDRARVYGVLDAVHADTAITLLITGACVNKKTGLRRGADALAEEWALEREVSYVGFPARWKTGGHGNAEGIIRNRLMYERWKPDRGIAFPGSTGTANMVEIMRAGGTPVMEIDKHRGKTPITS